MTLPLQLVGLVALWGGCIDYGVDIKDPTGSEGGHDTAIYRATTKLCQCADGSMGRWADGPMGRCADVPMCLCADEPMC